MYFFYVFQAMLGDTYKPLLCWLHYTGNVHHLIHGNLSCDWVIGQFTYHIMNNPCVF